MSFNKVDPSTGNLEQIAGATNMVDYAQLSADNDFSGENVSLGKHRVLKNTNMEVGGTPPSQTLGGNSALLIKDNANHPIAYVNMFSEPDGTIDMHISGNASGNPNGELYLAGKKIYANNKSLVPTTFTVTYDGVKTVGQGIAELETLLNNSGLSITPESYILNQGTAVLRCTQLTGCFCWNNVNSNNCVITMIDLVNHINIGIAVSTDGTIASNDYTNTAPTSGKTIQLVIA